MQNRTLASAASILAAMAIIGLIDQFVQVIARTSSLWTFHLLRAAMMFAMAGAWLWLRGARLRVHSWRGLAGRSLFMSTAMVIYFGALGFLPVAQAAAGLFSAPIWILVLSVTLFGLRIGPVRVVAALIGFAGVLLVLSPDPATIGPLTFVPIASGAFYAVAAIATREWCGAEQPLAIALGVFAGLALWGAGGIVVAGVLGEGTSYLTRGWVPPTGEVWFWTAVQAAGSLVAVTLLARGYQLAEASLASVFEFSVLGFSALFGWLVAGQATGPLGLAGLALIAFAGSLIALRGGDAEAPAAAP
ncbi:DMT family transporter [Jannaschia sp. W003]|uniref:DMT family transporter n=1 Tax=Jannaschia sp. W003 TaxID=2867012 RepID=UPI0021A3898C|nr:DMT family transporter [Jannaschia sp. W003]UWQ20351.1 DMT family transporter [Jannaschia sp. W003]